MSSLSIQDIARSTHVDRWQIVRTLRKQNIAEHQYMVTMIALEIAERVMKKKFDYAGRLNLMDWCLRHDLPEVYMGDICTPVKQRIREAYGKGIFTKIEDEICYTCSAAKEVIKGTIFEGIAKLADLTDGIRFLTLEGHGEHAESVLRKIQSMHGLKLNQMKERHPEFEWSPVLDIKVALLSDECGYIKFEGLQ